MAVDTTLLRNAANMSDDFIVPVVRNQTRQQSGNANGKQPPVGAAKETDFVDDIEAATFNMPMNLGLMAASMGGFGLLAKGADKIGAQPVASGLRVVGDAKFKDLARVPGLGTVAGSFANGGMNALSWAAKPLDALGISGMASNYYANKAMQHEAALKNAMDVVSHHAANSGNAELKQALAGVQAHVAQGMPVREFGHGLDDALKVSHNTLAGMGHSNGFFGIGGSKGASMELTQALKTIEKKSGALEVAHSFSGGYKNLSGAIKGSVPKMANAGVWHGLMQGTFIVGAAASDYHTAKDLKHAMADLKSMYCGITGEKPDDVSAFSLLVGKVPAPVAAARTELIKEFGVSAVLDAANTVYNIKMVAHHKFGNFIAMLGLAMGSSLIGHGLLGSSILPAYSKINDAQKAGEPATPEDYARLIGNASPELHKQGGETSNFTKALAMFYAEHQVKADVVMKEIENGALKKRMAALEQQANAHAAGHPQAHAEEPHNGQPHTQRLNGKTHPDRRILGPQTEKLVKASEGHAPGLSHAVS